MEARSRTRFCKYFLGILIIFISNPASAIELKLRNTLLPSDDGSVVMIENARSYESPKTKIRIKVFPGEIKDITNGNAMSFVVTREFPRHKLKYDISCSEEAKGEKTITLVEIHNGDLPKGCKLTRTGHWSKRTGMKWTEQ